MTTPNRYTKRPVTIEAMQWDGTAAGATPVIDWLLSEGGTARYHEHLMDGEMIAHPDPYLKIDTLEGVIIASAGDFIIRGIQGEFYPCKPDIFAATYDLPSETAE
jgi:hypothetical protein